MTWYHGGIAGLRPGDEIVPAPPHVTDGCLVCVARARSQVVTVGEFRVWLGQFGARARAVLESLEGAPDDAPIDPPSEQPGVYLTTHQGYAAWYASRSGHGDLYEVEPIGEFVRSKTDHFPSAVAPKARVVRVVRRGVRLLRRERRALSREWERADRAAARRKAAL